MKKTKLTLAIFACSAALALSVPAHAQTAVTTTTDSMNAAGTVSEIDPSMIMIRSTADAAPVHYTASKTTTYVDETGAPVSMEIVKSGAPVTVYYTKSGDDMIANRVVVTRSATTTTAAPVTPVVEEKKTTTTTTTEQ